MKKILDLLQELHEDEDFSKSEDFISDGLIDSVDLQHLVASIEKEYGVHLAGTDLLPQNFASVDAIRDLLENYGIDGDI